MLPYWIFFIVPALTALASAPLMRLRADGLRPLRIDALWILVILTLMVVVGAL